MGVTYTRGPHHGYTGPFRSYEEAVPILIQQGKRKEEFGMPLFVVLIICTIIGIICGYQYGVGCFLLWLIVVCVMIGMQSYKGDKQNVPKRN